MHVLYMCLIEVLIPVHMSISAQLGELKLVKCMLVKLGRMHYLIVSHCCESWSVRIVFLKRRTRQTTLSSNNMHRYVLDGSTYVIHAQPT